MWHWDQGRLGYFNFDNLRVMARFALANDFKTVDHATLQAATGLPFLPAHYMPWRNYSRVLKLSMIVSESGSHAIATPISAYLADASRINCDEYFHFLIRVFTEPSPALSGWTPMAKFRYPLLFSLRYVLAKLIAAGTFSSTLSEILGAYKYSSFTGCEELSDFMALVKAGVDFKSIGRSGGDNRQARESLKVISQISYLHYIKDSIVVSLDPRDATEIFDKMTPIDGSRARNNESEIQRLASLYPMISNTQEFEYKNTIISDVEESGFAEGGKLKRTHLTIERNGRLRRAFFEQNPTSHCDACKLDTHRTYPWVERVLDLHHLLPLSSGTRVEPRSTMFSDLVPVCPTCHRAVHRFYDAWLKEKGEVDFADASEAHMVYTEIKKRLEEAVSA